MMDKAVQLAVDQPPTVQISQAIGVKMLMHRHRYDSVKYTTKVYNGPKESPPRLQLWGTLLHNLKGNET